MRLPVDMLFISVSIKAIALITEIILLGASALIHFSDEISYPS
ncbi:hypothetical protein NOS3756_16690 [Nostoc sp. NIES-3756]|nr:hypothetical protein [Nostoc sp. NIES-3756]BAT52728.1 hypothetical protein NOS3756_16690 [Nostoc sp. NIES-3756]